MKVPKFVALWLLIVSTGCAEATAPPVAAEALHAIESFSPTRIGTDRQRRLWAWSREQGEVRVFDARGAETWSQSVPSNADGVDVDGEWGVILLGSDRRDVIVLRPDGTRQELRLTDEANSLAWVDAGTFASGPAFSRHRLQVWQIEDALMLDQMAEGSAVPVEPGAHLAHTTEIAHLGESQGWALLDSYSGALARYSPSGRVLSQAEVEDPGNEAIESWLKDNDEKARDTGEVQRPGIWKFHLALDAAGDAWVVEGCSEDGQQARLLQLDTEGQQLRHSVPTSCCSRHFTIFERSLLFHDKGRAGTNGCLGTGRLP